MNSFYKVRFKPTMLKENPQARSMNESDVSMFFKEVTADGTDKLSFDKKNNRLLKITLV